jgi:hypothetical protein
MSVMIPQPDRDGPQRSETPPLDPLFVLAAAEVDRGLLQWSLRQSPRERLRNCSRASATFAKLRRGAPTHR